MTGTTLLMPTMLSRLQCAHNHIHYALENLRAAQRLARKVKATPMTHNGIRNILASAQTLWLRLDTLATRFEKEETP